jgi:hypothetical protein
LGLRNPECDLQALWLLLHKPSSSSQMLAIGSEKGEKALGSAELVMVHGGGWSFVCSCTGGEKAIRQ